MEYTTMPQVMEKLNGRFQDLDGHKAEAPTSYE
jgi:fructose 1,6-bisphosphatase